MVSAFQSRETGFGVEMIDQQLKEVNDNRKNEDYFDKTAANEIYGSSKKQQVTKPPFVHLFEFGGQNGY